MPRALRFRTRRSQSSTQRPMSCPPQPVGNSQGLNTNLGLGINIGYFDRPLPYSHQSSLGLERQLGRNWLVEVAYVGNKSRRLPVSANVNVIPAGELGKPASYYTEKVSNPLAGRI